MASLPTSDSQNSATLEYSLPSPNKVVLVLDESDEAGENEVSDNETDKGNSLNTNQQHNPFLDFVRESQIDEEQKTLSYSLSAQYHADDSDKSESVPSSPLDAVDIPNASNDPSTHPPAFVFEKNKREISNPENTMTPVNRSNESSDNNINLSKDRPAQGNNNIIIDNDTVYVNTQGENIDPNISVDPNLVDVSISQDAAQLSAIFENVDTEHIHNKLSAVESLPNRIEIVTNQLLEEQEQNFCLGNSTINDVAEQDHVSPNENSNDDAFGSVIADIETVLDMLTTQGLANLPDRNLVFEVLEQVGNRDIRVMKTVDQFIQWEGMKEVSMEVDPSVLERSQVVDRSQVTDDLPAGINHQNQEIQNELLAFTAHPLFEDLLVVAKVFPHRDPNELMAYLEVHHDKPHRVPLVIDELLNLDSVVESQHASYAEDLEAKRRLSACDDVEFVGMVAKKVKVLEDKNDEVWDDCVVIGDERMEVNNATTETETTVHATATEPSIDSVRTKLQEDFEVLKSLIPDADPNYIFDALESMVENPNRVHDLANMMLEKRDYPKLKDVIQEQQKNARKQKIMGLKFDMEEFLRLFDDPVQYFYNEEKKMSDNYTKHCIVKLINEFPMLTQDYIVDVLKKHNNHFLPAMRDLEKDQQQEFMLHFDHQQRGAQYKGFHNRKKYRLKARTSMELWPEDLDEMFFKELLFMHHEQEIQERVERKKRDHKNKVEKARTAGELQECQCCYEDELLFSDMVTCEDGHLFCRECVRRSSEEVIGRSRVDFPCLAADCNCHFAMSVLQKVLLPSVFSNLIKRIQEEEIRKADIPNLEMCPFCSFATIMDNPEDKVFKCLNTDCLKESCRLCKELNHVPLRCEEVEKENETKKRTFIENQMTEAMLRTCWKCKKKFFKEDGCNKMTCECGASMCYVCRQPIKGYEHFGFHPGQCPPTLNIDHKTYHMKEVASAGKKAKETYHKENPDEDVDLKYDPLKDVPKDFPTTTNTGIPHNQGIPFHNPFVPPGFQFFQMPPMQPVPPPPPPPAPPQPPAVFQIPAFGDGRPQQIAFNAPGIHIAAQGLNVGFPGGPLPEGWNPFHGQNPGVFNPAMNNDHGRQRQQRR